MGSSLTEAVWAPLLAALGVFVGWWLRHWSERSVGSKTADCPQSAGAPSARGPSPTDSVTGLSSRATLVDDLQRRIAEFRRTSGVISLLLMRIDNYDQLLCGRAPEIADQLLVAMSQFLRATVRDMDHVARIDDRTFGILLAGADEAAALSVAERLSSAVSGTCLPAKDEAGMVYISVGATQAHKGDTGSDVLARAESVLIERGLTPRRLECTLKLG